jgi:hypothetical protein
MSSGVLEITPERLMIHNLETNENGKIIGFRDTTEIPNTKRSYVTSWVVVQFGGPKRKLCPHGAAIICFSEEQRRSLTPEREKKIVRFRRSSNTHGAPTLKS